MARATRSERGGLSAVGFVGKRGATAVLAVPGSLKARLTQPWHDALALADSVFRQSLVPHTGRQAAGGTRFKRASQ